jgi:hypothetical protein
MWRLFEGSKVGRLKRGKKEEGRRKRENTVPAALSLFLYLLPSSLFPRSRNLRFIAEMKG